MNRTSYPENLACPIDFTPLTQQHRQLCCVQAHHFDIARHGYVNLLPVQHKKSKAPGDNKEMVAARTQFLNTQLFEPIAEQLNNMLLTLLADAKRDYCVLDAGCGDGYYLDYVFKTSIPSALTCIGVDISKFAIMAAAKRNPHLTWVVGGNKQLPVIDHSVDVIISAFGFPSPLGFARALAAGGHIILVEPGAKHLIELRKQLYEEIEESTHKNRLLPLFDVVGTQTLAYQTRPLTNGELINLLKMTPHFYRAPKQAIENACQQSDLSVTVDVDISVCKRASDG